jgi:hypothetical protein
MWKKLPGGIKLDPMQPKLSTNNYGFQTASKSGHQFLRRFSEHRAATHLLIKKWNLSLNRTEPSNFSQMLFNAPSVARVGEIDCNGPEVAIGAFMVSEPFCFACRLYFMPASTCQR